MAYSVYYPSGCDVEVGQHYCNVCPTPELGRIRSVAFIKTGFEFNDPTDPTEWELGISNMDIIIIPQTNGSFDGGTEVESAGYGDQSTKLVGYNFTATYGDPDYKDNAAFYNTLKRSRNYRFAYRTENLVHITDSAVSVIPKSPVGEDINSEVVWSVLVKWSEADLPVPYVAPAGIFECFDYVEA